MFIQHTGINDGLFKIESTCVVYDTRCGPQRERRCFDIWRREPLNIYIIYIYYMDGLLSTILLSLRSYSNCLSQSEEGLYVCVIFSRDEDGPSRKTPQRTTFLVLQNYYGHTYPMESQLGELC